MSNKIHNIPLTLIDPDPDQPRRYFDDDALAALSASIEDDGLLQPIEVTGNGNGRYTIVHGERRYRASRLAGCTTIRAIINDAILEGVDRLYRQAVENAQREDLGPIDEAKMYQRLMDAGESGSAISRRLGVSYATITNRLLWLDTEEDVQQLVNTGRLPRDPRAARALLSLPAGKPRIAMAKDLARRNAKIKTVVNACNALGERLAQRQKPTAPSAAPALSLSGVLPRNGRIGWERTRYVAAETCRACSLYDMAGIAEPAWAMMLETVKGTCDTCMAQVKPSITVCRECPMVDMLRRMAAVSAPERPSLNGNGRVKVGANGHV